MEEKGIVKVNEDILAENNEIALDLSSPEKILSFGDEATKGISRFADEILSQFSLSFAEESSKLLNLLSSLMGRFDRVDFQEQSVTGSFLSRFLQKIKKRAGDLYDKYMAFNGEIDKIFVEIKKYELEIKDTKDMLDRMYTENMHFYKDLDRYIGYATAYLTQTVEPAIKNHEEKLNDPDSGWSQLELGRYRELKDTLEQRINDLELAKAVSLQTAPQIKLIQKGNYNLIRKINSAFVITMPLFKQGIIQAITVKRQKLHMDSMKALDDSTNKLLLQNAQNITDNAKQTAQMNLTGSVRLESIEESYNIIINGIKEVEMLQLQNKKQREESIRKLESYKTALITGVPICSEEAVELNEA